MKGLPPDLSYSHMDKVLVEGEKMHRLSVGVITASCVKGEREMRCTSPWRRPTVTRRCREGRVSARCTVPISITGSLLSRIARKLKRWSVELLAHCKSS